NWTTNAYDVGGVTGTDILYDLNGNIKELARNNNSGNLLDALTYTYTNNNSSNQLASVSDASLNLLGFKDGTNVEDDYSYDDNGNMVQDLNKGISNIAYNYMNLPSQVTRNGNTTDYVYTAAGVKLEHFDGLNNKKTEYIGNFVYEDGSLAYILTPEGRVMVNSGAYSYEYNLKDHLGNTRVVMDQTGNLVQATDYYPFGMRQEPVQQLGSDNKYLFGGKEMQEDTELYDYGWRMYDPAIARWNVIDPHTENHFSYSPYNYCLNNPMLLIDPDGADTSFSNAATRQAFIDTKNNAEKAQAKAQKKLDKTMDKWNKNISSNRLERKAERQAKALGEISLVNSMLDYVSDPSTEMFHYSGFTPVEKADGTIVESGGGSKWNSTTNRYETSFFLGAKQGQTIVHESRHGMGYLAGEFNFSGHNPVKNSYTDPVGYDYMDEYEGFKFGSYYNKHTGSSGYRLMTDKALKKHVIKNYRTKKYIIKSFKQIKP
ncbi:MAG TPA: hypothetical protein DDX98_14725, partial [Bacteroidales bacterium]|nr:hypothetical protein [Bacteroidales bacterium]